MDNNIFNLLDDDAEMPKTIQEKIKSLNVEKGGIDKDDSGLKSKAITGKKNKTKRYGKQRQFKEEAKLEKKKKKNILKAKSKNTY